MNIYEYLCEYVRESNIEYVKMVKIKLKISINLLPNTKEH